MCKTASLWHLWDSTLHPSGQGRAANQDFLQPNFASSTDSVGCPPKPLPLYHSSSIGILFVSQVSCKDYLKPNVKWFARSATQMLTINIMVLTVSSWIWSAEYTITNLDYFLGPPMARWVCLFETMGWRVLGGRLDLVHVSPTPALQNHTRRN